MTAHHATTPAATFAPAHAIQAERARVSEIATVITASRRAVPHGVLVPEIIERRNMA